MCLCIFVNFNIFDCVFYGKIFDTPYGYKLATLFPVEGGYAGWFEGRVVDMLYFPFFSFYWPDWMPIVGGQHFEFFQYIFNKSMLVNNKIMRYNKLMFKWFSRNEIERDIFSPNSMIRCHFVLKSGRISYAVYKNDKLIIKINTNNTTPVAIKASL